MSECIHVACKHKAEIAGLCRVHWERLVDENNGVTMCYNCRSIVGIYEMLNKPKPSEKIAFSLRCRNCGGDPKDETEMVFR